MKHFLSLAVALVMAVSVWAQTETYTLENGKIAYSLSFRDGIISGDTLRTLESWAQQNDSHPFAIVTDADFSIDIFWTGWSAPGKKQNADNDVHFTKKDFILDSVSISRVHGGQKAEFFFKPEGHHLLLAMTYFLPDSAFYIRKKLTIRDTVYAKHYLRFMAPLDFIVPQYEVESIVKKGGFGQPIGFLSSYGGAFYGLEYPAGTQLLKHCTSGYVIKAYQEIGQIIDDKGISSDWAVLGLSPDKNLKLWFYRYIDDIRVAPLRPYTLYNSWYDLRSPQYPGITPDHVMNQQNVMRIIDGLEQNMVKKYGIHLDAFVLDDGWDVYESDWQLNKQSFPNGLKPVSDRLAQMGTVLGMWFGPTGGYSFRDKRISWMKAHGYEVCGKEVHWHSAMLDLAGPKYSALFRKRITDFVKDYNVGYYKWDGIQFSCSDPKNGHPVGIYSRRAVMESVIDKCNAVRALNPDIFLNITSGTWLSPWWVKYANTIWMQGMDYGFAATPSISKRDAAMTYRDYVLYEDFVKNGFWFPISNLMTHGIIKGRLQKLGGESEPLDKFTNNALLYVARGVSMYELYISPDILTDAEWKAIAQSLEWAKANFDVLTNSFYFGGNPAKRQPYGYLHYKGKRGIVAVRNPFITDKAISIPLSDAYGLAADAQNLVVEQVYPYHQVLPRLYAAGDSVKVSLQGYETAVFEIYPVEQARYPLVTGAKFRLGNVADGKQEVLLYDINNPRILNPKTVAKITDAAGNRVRLQDLSVSQSALTETYFIHDGGLYDFGFKSPGAKDVQIAVLYENDSSGAELPEINLITGNDTLNPHIYREKNKWIWLTYDVNSDDFNGMIKINGTVNGNLRIYAIYGRQLPVTKVYIQTRGDVRQKVMPPQIYQAGYVRQVKEIGSI